MLQFLAEMSVLIGFCPGFPCLTPFESHLSQEIPIPSWSFIYILFSLQTKSIEHKSRTKSEHIAILKEDLDVSWNGGTPRSFISIGFSIINYPLLGTFILGNPHFQPFPCPCQDTDIPKTFVAALQLLRVEIHEVLAGVLDWWWEKL